MKHFFCFSGVRMKKTADFQALFSIQGAFVIFLLNRQEFPIIT